MRNEFGLWGATTAPLASLPVLDAARETEVAIVGAGYTGLSAALHLAEAGVAATVLEGHEPGWGGSGRNTGWLEPNWWLKKPSDIDALFGQERGAALSRWVTTGPRLLDRLSARYGLAFDFARTGLVMATADARRAAALASEAREWQGLDANVEYLDAAALRERIASDHYRGALWLRDGGTLNPLALTRELARACGTLAVPIFANSPVTAARHDGERWRLDTPGGHVSARRLLLATDSYTGGLWPALARSYATWHVALIASEPYAALADLLPGGAAFADLGLANVFTLRSDPAGRLLTSTFAPWRAGLSADAVAAPFMRKFRKIFPAAPAPRWQYVHRGEIGLSHQMMPRICSIGPEAWTAYGYSGTGINLALLLGAELAKVAASGDGTASLMPLTPLQPVPLRGLTTWLLRNVHAPLARHLLSRMA